METPTNPLPFLDITPPPLHLIRQFIPRPTPSLLPRDQLNSPPPVNCLPHAAKKSIFVELARGTVACCEDDGRTAGGSIGRGDEDLKEFQLEEFVDGFLAISCSTPNGGLCWRGESSSVRRERDVSGRP